MSYADLEQFDREIVSIEIPQLQNYLIFAEPVLERHQTKFMTILRKYI